MVKCDKCGFENLENAVYCQQCGKNLRNPTSNEEIKSRSSLHKLGILIIVIIGIIGIIYSVLSIIGMIIHGMY